MRRALQPIFWTAIFVMGASFWLLGLGFAGWHWYPLLMFVPLVGAPLFFLFETVRDWIKGRNNFDRSS